MAIRSPEWLDEQFLSRCLQGKENYKDSFKVLKFTTGLVVPKGYNYGSFIFRVNLDFKKHNEETTQTLSLIIKSPLENRKQEEITLGLEMDIESKFYSEYLPIANQLGNDSFGPKSYFSPNPLIIIMEDLKQQGFEMKEQHSHLDVDHCRLYVITSAIFHATSIAVHKIDAELVESLGEEKLFSEGLNNTNTFRLLMDQGLECTSDFIEKTKLKTYAKLVRDPKSYLMTEIIEAHKRSEKINSLNQGDPWIPNMMFKYDDVGKVSDIKLLDFQALRYGSPINDLVFFLWSSANHDVRENRLDEMYHLYCDTFNNKLQDLRCTESLSYSDLLEAVEVLKPLMLFIVSTFIPMQFNPDTLDIADIISKETDENGQEVNKMAKYFTESFCNNILIRYLEQLENVGIFDYLDRHG